METNDINYFDMTAFRPAEAISQSYASGSWQAVPYTLADGTVGTMLFAYSAERAPLLSLELAARGFYRIYIGVNYTRTPLRHGPLCLRLERDSSFHKIDLEVAGWEADRYEIKTGRIGSMWGSIHETLWRVCDLDNDTLYVKTASPTDSESIANISSIRLERVPEGEQSLWKGISGSKGTKELFFQWSDEMLRGGKIHDESFYTDEFQPLIESDAGYFVYTGVRGNACSYGTDIGDRTMSEGDPLATFAGLCRENGKRIVLEMEFGGESYPAISGVGSKFLRENRHLRKRDVGGNACGNVSFAYPEVRNHLLALVREASERYGIDGIQLNFMQGAPFSLYEERSRDDFISAFGDDLAGVALHDERFLQHRAGYVTRLIQEIGEYLHEAGLELGVVVPSLKREHHGAIAKDCDVSYWMKQRLVDWVVLDPDVKTHHTMFGRTMEIEPSFDIGGAAAVAVEDRYIEFLKSIGGTSVKIIPAIKAAAIPPHAYADMAAAYYEQGADGIGLLNGGFECRRVSEWSVASRLGHAEELGSLSSLARGFFSRRELEILNGFSVQYSFSDG